MNAAEPGLSRRDLLTRLLGSSQRPSSKGLSPVVLPNLPTKGVFWQLAAATSGILYLAGDDGTIGRLDDEDWQWEPLPTQHNIHALCTVAEDVYAVGWMGVICQRGGDGWECLRGGADQPGRENLPLFDIKTDSNGGLWAVGDQGRITHFDGSDWQEFDSTDGIDCEANFRAVLPLADGNILVSGTGGSLTELDRSTGVWKHIPTDTSCPLVSMAELADGSVLIVGGEYSVQSNGFEGRLFLYADGSLETVSTEHLPRLRRVHRVDDEVYILGDHGLALLWNAQSLHTLSTNTRYDLHDVVKCNDNVWFCGDNASLMQLSETAAFDTKTNKSADECWSVLSEGTSNGTLRALCTVSDEYVIAGGDGGLLAHIENNQVTWDRIPSKQRIHAFWASSSRNIYAACEAGTISHFDGETWQTVHKGNPGNALLAIAGFGPHDIFAVGDNGYALRYDGLMWREIETGVSQELYGLWGKDSDHLLAVGGGGLVLRWNGKEWKPFHAGTDQDLYGVCGRGLDQILLCGLAGRLIRFADNAWQREFTGVRSDLHAVQMGEDSSFCVGSHGTVLRETLDSNNNFLWDLETTPTDNSLHTVLITTRGAWAAGSFGTILHRA